MVNSKAIIILGLLCSLLIAGCSGQEQQQPDLTEPFIGGTQGLNTYLLEGVPPKLIQDNNQSPFSYAVVLENVGEADVGPGTNNEFVRVSIDGINPERWNLNETSRRLNQPLRSSRKNFDGTVLPGEITQVAFERMQYEDDIKGNTQFVIRGEVCYDYTTTSTTKICIKDDVLENIQDESLCSLSGEKNPKNSGAPLHITSVVQQPLGQNKIQLRFTVEHVGPGEFYGRPQDSNNNGVIDSNEQETCDPSTNNFNKHEVHVLVKPISDSGYSIKCPRFGGDNQDTVKLWQGAPQVITCTLERTRDSQGRIFQDILEIQLRYRYGQFIETPIIVQDVSNEPGLETES